MPKLSMLKALLSLPVSYSLNSLLKGGSNSLLFLAPLRSLDPDCYTVLMPLAASSDKARAVKQG